MYLTYIFSDFLPVFYLTACNLADSPNCINTTCRTETLTCLPPWKLVRLPSLQHRVLL